MNDKEVIEKVSKRFFDNEYESRHGLSSEHYYCRVLVRYTRRLEKAKYQPKPDESRLLSEEEFIECAGGISSNTDAERAGEPWIFGAKLIQKQDAKTASILEPQIRAKTLREVGEAGYVQLDPNQELKIPENPYGPPYDVYNTLYDEMKRKAFNDAIERFKELNEGFEPL